MAHLCFAVHLQPLLNESLRLFQVPHWDVNHVDRGIGVALALLVPAEVSDQRTDPQARNLPLLDRLNQPAVNIELLLPLDLVVHHCPRRGELVIRDDNAAL